MYDSCLLLVVLDGVEAADGCILGIAARVDQRSPLPQHIPTLIKPLL
jgi:hypothetical protein